MSDVAIRVENLGKRYRIGGPKEPYGSLRDSLMAAARSPLRALRGGARTGTEDFWALKDVSFEVKRGEVLGVIGRNGAGKSTLLKVLSRITEPTEGRAEIRGRVGSLLEVGTGFHPELTGRENIYLSGAILGMSRAEITRKFNEIVAFAEVDQFVDTPVKRFSSGMYLRLAFSVAAHLEPEILIVDEVLAVGDVRFQEKCLGKMSAVAGEGRTVLIVSHNLGLIRTLCTRLLLLRTGTLVADGKCDTVLATYVADRDCGPDTSIADRPRTKGSGTLRITGVRQRNLRTGWINEADILDPISITIDYDVIQPVAFFAAEWRYRDISGMPLVYSSSSPLSNILYNPRGHKGSIRCEIPRIPFSSGEYILDVALTHPNIEYLDEVEDACRLRIITADPLGTGAQYSNRTAPMYIDTNWCQE